LTSMLAKIAGPGILRGLTFTVIAVNGEVTSIAQTRAF
jgi:hypothetical protein